MKDNSTIWQRSEQLLRYLRGGLNAAEEAELKTWLEKHPEHQELLNQLLNGNGLDEDLNYISAIKQDQAWADLKHRLNITTKPVNRVVPLWKKLTVAASIVAAVGAGIWIYQLTSTGSSQFGNDLVYKNDIAPGKNTATLTFSNNKTITLNDAKTGIVISDELKYYDGSSVASLSSGGEMSEGQRGGNQTLVAATPRGGTYQVTLPDGTKVWLNAASKLEFPSTFNKALERVVKLDGEAYFEVARVTNLQRRVPFIVQTARQTVEVLGTHFNINSYTDESSIKTTLLEGSVRVAGAPGNVILKPGEQAVLTNSIAVKQVDVNSVVDWKNGEFSFESEPLGNIMRKVQRWYDVQVVYEQPSLENIKFSGTISRFEHVSKLLGILQTTRKVDFKIENKKIIVTNHLQ